MKTIYALGSEPEPAIDAATDPNSPMLPGRKFIHKTVYSDPKSLLAKGWRHRRAYANELVVGNWFHMAGILYHIVSIDTDDFGGCHIYFYNEVVGRALNSLSGSFVVQFDVFDPPEVSTLLFVEKS